MSFSYEHEPITWEDGSALVTNITIGSGCYDNCVITVFNIDLCVGWDEFLTKGDSIICEGEPGREVLTMSHTGGCITVQAMFGGLTVTRHLCWSQIKETVMKMRDDAIQLGSSLFFVF